MSDADRSEFLPKEFRGPDSNYEKWAVGNTQAEIDEAREKLVREAWLKSIELDPLLFKPRFRVMHEDERRDLGYHNMRDLFNPSLEYPEWQENNSPPEPRED